MSKHALLHKPLTSESASMTETLKFVSRLAIDAKQRNSHTRTHGAHTSFLKVQGVRGIRPHARQREVERVYPSPRQDTGRARSSSHLRRRQRRGRLRVSIVVDAAYRGRRIRSDAVIDSGG